MKILEVTVINFFFIITEGLAKTFFALKAQLSAFSHQTDMFHQLNHIVDELLLNNLSIGEWRRHKNAPTMISSTVQANLMLLPTVGN